MMNLEDERYQKRIFALAVFVMTIIVIFWSLCILVVPESQLANIIAGALTTPFGAVIYFFFRKAKELTNGK